MQLRSGKVFHSSASIGVDVNKNISKTDDKPINIKRQMTEEKDSLMYMCSKQAEWSKRWKEGVKERRNELKKKMKIWRDNNKEGIRESSQLYRDKRRYLIREKQEIRNEENKIKKIEVNSLIEEIKRVEEEKIKSPRISVILGSHIVIQKILEK
jgi:hypothetical protein